MGKLKAMLLTGYFFTLFLVSSAVVIPVLAVLVAFWQPFHSRRSTMRRVRRAISFYGRIVTLLPWPAIRVRYEDHGGNNTPGPYIFVANHRSASDAFLMCVLPHEAVQVVNTWPFRIPVLGLFAKVAGYLNVKNMPPEEFMAKAGKLCREGVCLIFFPEGTRSGGRTMGNFHGSAFRLALQEKAAIVPLCITGNEKIPPKGSLLFHPGTIRVRRLPALRWEEFRDQSAFALKNRVRETIQSELGRMENGS
jgi:1-acyl-sn-glycerol-3-phosphate acyltransferase